MKKWQYNIELPAPRTGKKEFSFGEKGIVSCPGCQSVYYQKSWHHSKNLKFKIKNLKLKLCPACQMIRNKEFEGQLTISNFPPALETDLTKLIRNFCQRAYERDPMDRLISINQLKNQHKSASLIVTTTENQLAVKLAKKIKEVFNKNKVQIKISYSPEPSDAVYIKINFALPL
mgnify:CR=1 FL=1